VTSVTEPATSAPPAAAADAPPARAEPGGDTRRCVVHHLGRIGYREAAGLQEDFARALKRAQLDRGGDAARGASPPLERLLLLEHPPVITLGRNAREADVLAGRERLQALGVAVEPTNRGGQVTYHGPGQLVGYPILDLNPDRRDVGRYLRDLEEVLVRTLRRVGLEACRRTGWTGVWVEDRKIASIGVHLSRWVTTHGFALNVTTDLAHFDLIVPCGIRDRDVTSMARETGLAIAVEEVARLLVPEFGAVFGRAMEAG
jgi:lipoyl(octanoyl) transferase